MGKLWQGLISGLLLIGCVLGLQVNFLLWQARGQGIITDPSCL